MHNSLSANKTRKHKKRLSNDSLRFFLVAGELHKAGRFMATAGHYWPFPIRYDKWQPHISAYDTCSQVDIVLRDVNDPLKRHSSAIH